MPRLKQINVEKLAKILLIIFACSTVISFLSIYYTHQLPTYETQTTTLFTYQHVGKYDYIAELKPNIIYNKTTLTPGEGTLYTAIVNQINLTFTYAFTSNPEPENSTIEHNIIIQLESPGKWTKTLSDAEAQEMLKLSSSLNFTMQVNCTKIRELVDSIDKETGTRSTTYNINIKPAIHVVANVTTETIDENFTPELTVGFKTEAEKGNYIAIENLQQTKPSALTKTQSIYLQWVENQRAGSYIATAATTAALAISAFLYIKTKPPTTPTKIIEKLTAPYKELIAKTTKPAPETKTTIELETLEDLAKTAEILARPILHATDGKEHTFYVIDNNTKYQHKTKA
jgi:hypothetical protein